MSQWDEVNCYLGNSGKEGILFHLIFWNGEGMWWEMIELNSCVGSSHTLQLKHSILGLIYVSVHNIERNSYQVDIKDKKGKTSFLTWKCKDTCSHCPLCAACTAPCDCIQPLKERCQSTNFCLHLVINYRLKWSFLFLWNFCLVSIEIYFWLSFWWQTLFFLIIDGKLL